MVVTWPEPGEEEVLLAARRHKSSTCGEFGVVGELPGEFEIIEGALAVEIFVVAEGEAVIANDELVFRGAASFQAGPAAEEIQGFPGITEVGHIIISEAQLVEIFWSFDTVGPGTVFEIQHFFDKRAAVEACGSIAYGAVDTFPETLYEGVEAAVVVPGKAVHSFIGSECAVELSDCKLMGGFKVNEVVGEVCIVSFAQQFAFEAVWFAGFGELNEVFDQCSLRVAIEVAQGCSYEEGFAWPVGLCIEPAHLVVEEIGEAGIFLIEGVFEPDIGGSFFYGVGGYLKAEDSGHGFEGFGLFQEDIVLTDIFGIGKVNFGSIGISGDELEIAKADCPVAGVGIPAFPAYFLSKCL